ncbi:hypothetical protein D3C84_778640 [compost metagenome]
MLSLVTADQTGDGIVERSGFGESQVQRADLSSCGAPRIFLGVLGTCKNILCRYQEYPASITEYDAASYPVKKRRTNFILQITYLLSKRGLGDPKLFGCSCEVLRLGRNDEIT